MLEILKSKLFRKEANFSFSSSSKNCRNCSPAGGSHAGNPPFRKLMVVVFGTGNSERYPSRLSLSDMFSLATES